MPAPAPAYRHRMPRCLGLAIACAGCAYGAGSYHDLLSPGPAWPGARVELACLDVAIEPVHDAVAPDPVIALRFGNRCDHRVVVDLAAVRVTTGDVALAPHDPDRALLPRALPARWTGDETIAYEPAGATSRVCVDVGALERGTRSRGAVRCFDGASP